MIKQDSIQQILDTARIEEVVGDFVALKKRGANLLGLCPFHSEKTPSFMVSPAKGLFKCFGCGKGGDSLRFVMEHEKYSYPEALRYVAKKYNITLEETENTQEQKDKKDHREQLLSVLSYVSKSFQYNLFDISEGQVVGLSYFNERGFREDVVRKFELGYSIEDWEGLKNKAIKDGYSESILEELGLLIKNEERNTSYDRFRGRVIFPIHNFTGRVIGFGGRILTSDKKAAKYINSPESEVYHKSRELYGLFFARKAIRELDNCYLVEGYADVIAVHQAGVENVVSSSGTSLTVEQIKLIGRFTPNITILYDGDEAGIKASLRGLDLILEQGMNVKVVLFPEGHDPDSFIKAYGATTFKTHIAQNAKDFVLYKADMLLKSAGTDPIKRAHVIREVVESIAKITDGILASIFVKECAELLDVEERVLLLELNKIRLAKANKTDALPLKEIEKEASDSELTFQKDQKEFIQEKEIIRILLHYGALACSWQRDIYIAQYILANLSDIVFEHPVCVKIWTIYQEYLQREELPKEQYFMQHEDEAVKNLVASLLIEKYTLSERWLSKHKIFVPQESDVLPNAIKSAIYHLKKYKIEQMINKVREELKQINDVAEETILLDRYHKLKIVEAQISAKLGTVILR